MSLIATETPIPDKVVSLKRLGGYQLEAHLEGTLVFPVVTDFSGASQYPGWDPFRSRLTLWDDPIPFIVANALSVAWASALAHPSFGKMQ